MKRHIRYQGAIVRDHQILLLKQRIFPSGLIIWLFPGGGMEQGETEGDMKREMKEETNLEVKVNRLLFFNEPALDGDTFSQRLRTYLCEPLSGVAKPGYNPEYDPPIEAAGLHGILEVKWFDLRNEVNWDSLLINGH